MQCGTANALVNLLIDPAGLVGVVLAQLLQIFAPHGADLGGLIFINPFACSLRTGLFGDRRELVQGILISGNSNGKITECKRIAIANAALPIADD